MHGPEDIGPTIRTWKFYRHAFRHEVWLFTLVEFLDSLLGGIMGRMKALLSSKMVPIRIYSITGILMQ